MSENNRKIEFPTLPAFHTNTRTFRMAPENKYIPDYDEEIVALRYLGDHAMELKHSPIPKYGKVRRKAHGLLPKVENYYLVAYQVPDRNYETRGAFSWHRVGKVQSKTKDILVDKLQQINPKLNPNTLNYIKSFGVTHGPGKLNLNKMPKANTITINTTSGTTQGPIGAGAGSSTSNKNPRRTRKRSNRRKQTRRR